MLRPRVKPVFVPVPVGGRTIRIGDFNQGLAAELIDDDRRRTWHLLMLLDGTRTREDVHAAMRRHDPAVTVADVDAAITDLAEAGYVDDAAAAPPDGTFSSQEIERYRRNVEFFSYFSRPQVSANDMQRRLAEATVTVAGLGGLGSYVALALASLGVGNLHVVDNDVVDRANLNRQVLYTEADIGASKVDAAVRRLALVNPHVRIDGLPATIDGVATARTLMSGRDLFVCAVDRPRVHIYEWINKAALAERTPWIRAGNPGLNASAFLHIPYDTACFDCAQLRSYEALPWLRGYTAQVVEQMNRRSLNPCNAAAAGLTASIVALESMKLLTGMTPPAILGRRVVVDLVSLGVSYAEVERHPECPSCGDGRSEPGRAP